MASSREMREQAPPTLYSTLAALTVRMLHLEQRQELGSDPYYFVSWILQVKNHCDEMGHRGTCLYPALGKQKKKDLSS